jgi:dTMP kinase
MFIVFEGGDGTGKSTQIKLLSKYLQKNNISHIVTKEPGGTPVGEDIRKILLQKNTDIYKDDMSPITESYLFAASRAEHIQKVIKPALAKNKIVLCDRFIDSSIAYQSAGRGISEKLVRQINAPAIQNISPDVIFLLDLKPENAYINKVKDRIEKANIHKNVRKKYLEIASNNKKYVTLDASLNKFKIHKMIINKLGI